MSSPATVLGRVKGIARANVNSLLNEAENPQAKAEELIANYDEAIQDARQAVQEAITSLRTTEARQHSDEEELTLWRDRAQVAAARARGLQAKDPASARKAEDLALVALKKEQAVEIRMKDRAPGLVEQLQLVEGLKRGIEQMEERFAVLQDRHDALIARSRFAEAQGKVATVTKETNSSDPTSKLSTLERSVKEQEAMARGKMELAQLGNFDQQFRELEETDSNLKAEKRLSILMGSDVKRAQNTKQQIKKGESHQ